MGNLDREDVFLWTREQSAAIRKAAEARSNLLMDWENVAEGSKASATRSEARSGAKYAGCSST